MAGAIHLDGFGAMSRGPGKLQRAILDRLAGRNCKVYRSGANMGLTTYELTEEMREDGLVPEERRTSGYRVYRACIALYRRGLIDAEASSEWDRFVRFTWSWSLKGKGLSSKPQ